MAGTAELVGIGNALVDVFSLVDEDMGPLFNLENGRPTHLSHERLGEILAALPEPVLSSGGGTANVVKLASGLGLSSAFIGCVGSNPAGKADRFAQFFEKELRSAGVSTYLSRSSEPTGACAILRFGEDQNYIAASPSAALSLKPEDIDADLIKNARVLVLDGFLLAREELVNRALNLADEAGTAIALDVSSVHIASSMATRIEFLVKKYPIILFLNEAEADAFCNALQNPNQLPSDAILDRSLEDDTERFAILQRLSEAGPFPIIVVKRGSRGALLFAGGSLHDATTRSAIPFDTTGAGDAFAAAFLCAWIKEKPLSDCAAAGNKTAREILTVPGTKLSLSRLRALRKIFC